ncbi:putative Glycine hydroxymethyltransferase [Desulfamplus magnetovallimortis]|uniref:Putative Glycine hydroxymethyltransferase n=1 Tax=Desulfamplus magnetovallimortis TaxID=1246637 RepID=A0A1W1H756_9BACT|nr:glycine cleavage system aminomethyltransferase GcvT [Desulfamplus magnetovallimortis]SLM28311.1 putative Glycine hydroxymethyltransferase [Desulfamplus magnetovallimortis]
MSSLNRTFFNEKHRDLGATMVDFGGWDMPVQYKKGVIHEHLSTRKHAGLFDVSHMGRFIISGEDALPFLQRVLSNNAAALEVNESQYTIIPDDNGFAIDDAYLYRFNQENYLLVVNASNREKDWNHFREQAEKFNDLKLKDQTFDMGMLSLQGPESRKIMNDLIESGTLPIPLRNNLSEVTIAGAKVFLARTGYTGDPIGFELFMDKDEAVAIWELLISKGAEPIGLGARDTLRLEASLPLYGHEFGDDPEGNPIPVFACPLARFAVSFAQQKGDFIGKNALSDQFEALKRITDFNYSDIKALPRVIVPVAITGKGIARAGCEVYRDGTLVGFITSGTMVPCWTTKGDGIASLFSDSDDKRAIATALVDADVVQGSKLEIKIRKKMSTGIVVPYHMRAEAPPFARAIMWDESGREIKPENSDSANMAVDGVAGYGNLEQSGTSVIPTQAQTQNQVQAQTQNQVQAQTQNQIQTQTQNQIQTQTQNQTQNQTQTPTSLSPSQSEEKMIALIKKAIDNTTWRQKDCINLIPSEQTASSFARMLSIMDPSGRYAEHKKVKAFHDHEVFYYQGTEFIAEVESLLIKELCTYLGCRNVESRVVSGQMANSAVFSAIVDYINRADRKSEQRRIRKIINNHILNGGHLSAQPMGALRDFVARDPMTEKPAVVNFPVCKDNPYRIDVDACQSLIEIHKPELVIFGKSMTLYPEPVAQIRKMVESAGLSTIIMYDMAHVLGLAGPHFQEPFKDGADLVTGSTHKTFFGTQRGIIAGNYDTEDVQFPLWEAIERRAFPGSVSNHHLGTMLGLLASTYEMNHFKDSYQKQVIANARAFASALSDLGMPVAGEKADGFTHTHQVILDVGYAKGAEVADFLEKNNIIVNYQATPEEEGFTASGALRMGVSEMTRFGMKENDFQQIAQLIHDAVNGRKSVGEKVSAFRNNFQELHFCFDRSEHLSGFMDKLSSLL